ncbi:uncharacterized protein C20orf96 homolog [Latimeria chalumnae]|uniref:uncharacterized protein C20orf96 homolog n=1 Tax=Latimeria chalumnae TaxID=7897 RepID=UPI00313C9B80
MSQKKKKELEEKRQKNLDIFEIWVKSLKQSKTAYKLYCTSLLHNSVHLSHRMKKTDVETANHCTDLLTQYDSLGKTICKVGEWSEEKVKTARAELSTLELMVKKELQGLEQEVVEVSQRLQEAQAQLHALKAYKDSGYSVKAMFIFHLQQKLKQLRKTNQQEEEEVVKRVRTRMDKSHQQAKNEKHEILDQVAQDKWDQLPPVFHLMVSSNSFMEREIEIYKKINEVLESQNSELQQKISRLLEGLGDVRDFIFPDVMLKKKGFSPEMEVYLDIPLEEWLPV